VFLGFVEKLELCIKGVFGKSSFVGAVLPAYFLYVCVMPRMIRYRPVKIKLLA